METMLDERLEQLDHEKLGEVLEHLDHDLAKLQLALDDRSTKNPEEGSIRKSMGKQRKELWARRERLLQVNCDAGRKRCSEDKGKVICDAGKIEREVETFGEQKRKGRRKKSYRKGKGKGKQVCDVEKGKEDEVCDWNAEKYKDRLAFDYVSYKQFWEDLYAGVHGSFEDTTPIPCMRLTNKSLPYDATPFKTLEVFSVKVAKISESLQWPLDVFGVVALRDSADRNRNVLFSRKRDSCQTLTEKDPYLLLTGPLRAAILCDPVRLEATLHVRGTTESDDKELSLLSTSFWEGRKPTASYFTLESCTSRLSTLEFSLGVIVRSVEATISVKVSSGSWPSCFGGRFIAFTDSLKKEYLVV